MKILSLLVALLLVPSLAMSTTTRARIEQHRRSSAFKRDRGPPDRSSAMERCLHDGSRPKRMRRADVDLR